MAKKITILVLMAVILTACDENTYDEFIDNKVGICEVYIWEQVGYDIDGKNTDDRFGTSVSLNSNGSVVAIGSPEGDYVQIFQNESGIWKQIGLDIESEGASGSFGQSVSLNSDGSIVAIGVPLHYNGNYYNFGLVKVYENNGGFWTQLGNDITLFNGGFFGTNVSLDSSGSRIAIIDGSVRVSMYQINNGTWSQVGASIRERSNNLRSLAFSLDGSVVAYSTSIDDKKGYVSIYKDISGNWMKVGGIIEGEEGESHFGESISLNADGSIVAISGDMNISSKGFVKIYKNNSDQWLQTGKTIRGESVGDAIGTSVSLSSDGSRIAIGAHYSQNWAGHIRVFQNSANTWMQIADDIDGEAGSNLFGGSVSLSYDGLVVAGGAIWNNGIVSNSGHARVYKLGSISFTCTDD